MMANADITVYNKTTTKEGNIWSRTPVWGVSWQEDRKVAVGNNGLVTADETLVFIPFKSAPDLVVRKGDIIVRNVVIFDIDETKKESNVKALKHKYADVLTVMSAKKNDFGSPDMQHWEVVLQ